MPGLLEELLGSQGWKGVFFKWGAGDEVKKETGSWVVSGLVEDGNPKEIWGWEKPSDLSTLLQEGQTFYPCIAHSLKVCCP